MSDMNAPWRRRALCLEVADTATFYPGKGESHRPAKRICALCPVTAACLADALATKEADDYGVRGGTSAFERRAIRRRSRLAPVVALPTPTVPEQPRRAA